MFISTAAFVSVLALASSVSSMAVVRQATGPRTQCTQTYNVPQGETCDALASKLGLSQTSIESLNTGITCNGASAISANQELCIKGQTPTCASYATATDTTCDGLASQGNITPKEFVQYNENVNDDCTNLVVGQPYCVAIDASENTEPANKNTESGLMLRGTRISKEKRCGSKRRKD